MTDATAPELWLYLKEGLCNRLRVLLSAIGYAQMTGRTLVVHWSMSPGGRVVPLLTGLSHKPFLASFADLFEPEATPCLREVTRAEWKAMRRSPASQESAHPPDPSSAHPLLWLDTYDEFYRILPKPQHAYARELRPARAIRARAADVLSKFTGGAPRIGVHARSVAAHASTAEYSSLEWFEAEIARLLALEDSDDPLFLSTDDEGWSRVLHSRFPGRLVESATPPRYNSREGIEKGLLDLTILAASEHIVGSYFSSFSDMAFDLQGRRSYSDAVRPSEPPPARSERSLGSRTPWKLDHAGPVGTERPAGRPVGQASDQ